MGEIKMYNIEKYYIDHNEDVRFASQHGKVEYLTTMKYIYESLKDVLDPMCLEIGAGTGRYSVALAQDGFRVTAVEPLEYHMEILRSKCKPYHSITLLQSNALNLYELHDNTFDLSLVLGPMYHLYTAKDRLQALLEAVRVTKPGGRILVAYCMNDPNVIQYLFLRDHILESVKKNKLTQDWSLLNGSEDIFGLVRTEDIDALDAQVPVNRLKLVATSGASYYMAIRDCIDAMDDEHFSKWMEYHLTTCERQDLIGASHQVLDILEKRPEL